MRSVKVVLPESMWALMPMLRMWESGFSSSTTCSLTAGWATSRLLLAGPTGLNGLPSALEPHGTAKLGKAACATSKSLMEDWRVSWVNMSKAGARRMPRGHCEGQERQTGRLREKGAACGQAASLNTAQLALVAARSQCTARRCGRRWAWSKIRACTPLICINGSKLSIAGHASVQADW